MRVCPENADHFVTVRPFVLPPEESDGAGPREFAPLLPDDGAGEPWEAQEGADALRSPKKARPKLQATPFVWRDPRTLPRRQFVYGRHFIRRFLSSTASPGGVGKTAQALVEAVAMASGRNLLGDAPSGPLRVWYWNGEDPREEIERRIAAICIRYAIEPDELGGRLFIDSGRDSEIVLATETKDGAKLAEPAFADLEATIRENKIDVLVLDPFIAIHSVSENDNAKVNMVLRQLARLADRTNIACELVHHVRKGQSGQGEFTVEDSRGASAFRDAVRSARVLNGMTKEEAEKAGVPSHRAFFRVDNGKANLAPPPETTEWRQIMSVDLGNSEGNSPSDHVGVVVPWTWPSPLDDVTTHDLRAAQQAVSEGGPWRENHQAKDWIGYPIAQALGLDPADPKHVTKVRGLLKVWMANRMFVPVTRRDPKRRDERTFIEVGQWASD